MLYSVLCRRLWNRIFSCRKRKWKWSSSSWSIISKDQVILIICMPPMVFIVEETKKLVPVWYWRHLLIENTFKPSTFIVETGLATLIDSGHCKPESETVRRSGARCGVATKRASLRCRYHSRRSRVVNEWTGLAGARQGGQESKSLPQAPTFLRTRRLRSAPSSSRPYILQLLGSR